MLFRLFLLFTLVPALELYLLIWIGQRIGGLETVAIIAVTGLIGATLAKREGLGLLRQLQAELARGLPPADRLIEGLLVLIGGVLLVTPGVLTDLTGFVLIAPPTRRWLAPRLRTWAMARLASSQGGGFTFQSSTFTASVGGLRPGPAAPDPEPPPPPHTFDHPVS